jgi:predicted kinase
MRALLITGLPGAGKTTLARVLASRYGVPVIAKDSIKEPLLDVLGASGPTASRILSDASFAVLFGVVRELAAAGCEVIVEGNFRPGEHERPLTTAVGASKVIQVLCRVEEGERIRRLDSRRRNTSRHRSHGELDPTVMADRTSDAFLALQGERVIYQDDADAIARAEALQSIDHGWHNSGQ